MRIARIARIVVAVVLLFWLCLQIDVARLADLLKTGNPTLLWWGLFFFLLSCIATEGLRFHMLIKDNVASYFLSVKVLVESYFINTFLPSNIGGDGYKIRYLAKDGHMGWNRAVVVVVVERVIGLIVLLAAGCLYLLFCRSRIEHSLIFSVSSAAFHSRIFLVSLLTTLLVCLGFLLFPAGKFGNRVASRMREEARRSVFVLAEIPGALYVQLVAATIAFHGLMMLSLYFFLGWLHQPILFSNLVFVLFFTSFASLLPISPGAVGVKEGAMAVSLVVFGIPKTDALVVAFLDRILQLVIAAAGGVLFCFHKSRDGSREI